MMATRRSRRVIAWGIWERFSSSLVFFQRISSFSSVRSSWMFLRDRNHLSASPTPFTIKMNAAPTTRASTIS
ncbi:MAG: hypothetical protein ACYCVG_08975, partial [Leptospirillum sp.]